MNSKRTFLLGAGFSKSVSEAPLMNEIWSQMNDVYLKEKERKEHTNRVKWFKKLEAFINILEENAKNNFNFLDEVKVNGGIKENIEYLYTLIDLHINSGASFDFEKEDADVEPYPVIPFRFTSREHLKEIRRILSTFLYIIFVDLELKNDLLKKFSLILSGNDELITFNYDLLLEKSLWKRELWSPLKGYVGINKFTREEDYNSLVRNEKYSLIKLHKMHGSISWEFSFDNKSILLNLDDKENCCFYYDGLENILNRKSINFNKYDGYAGKYGPPWIFPSYIKPFNNTQIFKIWESAFNVLKNTKELIVIGYSFRPEDTNGQLLLANLPKDCKITVVDKYPKSIIKRLNTLNKEVDKYYDSLKGFLSQQ